METPVPKEKTPDALPVVEEVPEGLPQETGEDSEDAIIQGAFADSELVQIYKAQEKGVNNYWTLPAKKCDWKVPAVALVVHQTLNTSKEDLKALEALGVPVTGTILPEEESYQLIANHQFKHTPELFLALPLEPLGGVIKTPTLTRAMSPKTMADQLDQWLVDKPKIMGVASRMGSAFTKDAKAMGQLLRYLKQRGLVFLDSKNTNALVGPKVSHDVLALYLTRDFHFDGGDKKAMRSIEKALGGGKPLILYLPLQKRALLKAARWVRQKKRAGISFVNVGALVCASLRGSGKMNSGGALKPLQ